MNKHIKTAVSLPQKDFLLIESMRKKSGKSRSQIMVEALHVWWASLNKKTLEARYEEAYRATPENPQDTKGFLKASLLTLPKENW